MSFGVAHAYFVEDDASGAHVHAVVCGVCHACEVDFQSYIGGLDVAFEVYVAEGAEEAAFSACASADVG